MRVFVEDDDDVRERERKKIDKWLKRSQIKFCVSQEKEFNNECYGHLI